MSNSGGNNSSFPTLPAGAQLVVAGANGANQLLTTGLPVVAGKTAYIVGFDVSGLGATAATAVAVALSNSATLDQWWFNVIAGATQLSDRLMVRFPFPVPANNAGSVHNVNVPAFGAGNTNASLVVYGYYI